MSVVIATAFPDFGLLMSDSRVSIESDGKISRRDELQKIFQIGSHLAIGFTSNDVGLSFELIREITKYSLEKAKSQNTIYLLQKLPRVAAYYYKKLTMGIRNPPLMEFSYVGSVNDRVAQIPSKNIFDLMKKFKTSFTLSPEMQRALFSVKDGVMGFPPPTPIVYIQSFPENKNVCFNTLGVHVSGSGSGVFNHIKEEIEKILLNPYALMRIGMLQISIEEYCKKNNVDSVGGMNQIVIINGKGVVPQSYSTNTLFDENGKPFGGQKMVYEDGGWTQIDISTGKKIKVSHYNPLLLNKNDNKFTAFSRMIG